MYNTPPPPLLGWNRALVGEPPRRWGQRVQKGLLYRLSSTRPQCARSARVRPFGTGSNVVIGRKSKRACPQVSPPVVSAPHTPQAARHNATLLPTNTRTCAKSAALERAPAAGADCRGTASSRQTRQRVPQVTGQVARTIQHCGGAAAFPGVTVGAGTPCSEREGAQTRCMANEDRVFDCVGDGRRGIGPGQALALAMGNEGRGKQPDGLLFPQKNREKPQPLWAACRAYCDEKTGDVWEAAWYLDTKTEHNGPLSWPHLEATDGRFEATIGGCGPSDGCCGPVDGVCGPTDSGEANSCPPKNALAEPHVSQAEA